MELTFREAAGTFTQNTGYGGTFGFFDPTFAQIPHNELLDSRTDYLSTMADATYLTTPPPLVQLRGYRLSGAPPREFVLRGNRDLRPAPTLRTG